MKTIFWLEHPGDERLAEYTLRAFNLKLLRDGVHYEDGDERAFANALHKSGCLYAWQNPYRYEIDGVRVVAWATSLEEARSRYEDQQGDV